MADSHNGSEVKMRSKHPSAAPTTSPDGAGRTRWGVKRLLSLISIGALGAGLLIGSATRAGATTNPTTNGQDSFTGYTISHLAVAGLSTGTILVGTFGDSDESAGTGDYSAVIQWGDGQSSVASVDQSTGNIFGSHTYTAASSYPVTVDFTDIDEGTVTLSDGSTGTTLLSDGTATVYAPDLVGTSSNVSPVENTSFTGVVANFSDIDNSFCSVGQDVTATVHWGDGTSSPGTPGCDGSVTGTHTYAGDEGTNFPITVDVSDADEPLGILPDLGIGNAELSGGTATLADAAINNSPTSPILVEAAPFSGVSLGIITDTDPLASLSDYSVAKTCYNDLSPNTVNDCHPSVLTPVVNHANQFTVSGSGVFLEEGSYNVQTFISDGTVNPQEIVMSTPVTVQDAALTVSSMPTIQAKPKATFKKVVANFTDADPNGATSDYTATIDWGDGSTPTGGAIAPNGLGGWTVTGTHSYNKAGGYSATVTVHDSGGAHSSTVDVVRCK